MSEGNGIRGGEDYIVEFNDGSSAVLPRWTNESEDQFIEHMIQRYQALSIIRKHDGVLVYKK